MDEILMKLVRIKTDLDELFIVGKNIEFLGNVTEQLNVVIGTLTTAIKLNKQTRCASVKGIKNAANRNIEYDF